MQVVQLRLKICLNCRVSCESKTTHNLVEETNKSENMCIFYPSVAVYIPSRLPSVRVSCGVGDESDENDGAKEVSSAYNITRSLFFRGPAISSVIHRIARLKLDKDLVPPQLFLSLSLSFSSLFLSCKHINFSPHANAKTSFLTRGFSTSSADQC